MKLYVKNVLFCQNLNLLYFFAFTFLFSFFNGSLFAQGGTNAAAASASPVTLPINVTGTTVGNGDDIRINFAPVDFYTKGSDWVYYFCAPTTTNLTTVLSFATSPSYSKQYLSLHIWKGIPNNGGTLVDYQYTDGNEGSSNGVMGFSYHVTANDCYYIVVDGFKDYNYTLTTNFATVNPACTNLGFESGTFANWTASFGKVVEDLTPEASIPRYLENCYGVSPEHHVITSSGNDERVPNLPKVCPDLGPNSIRLALTSGNYNANTESAASVEQYFSVTQENALLTYYYAVVFDGKSDHEKQKQPFFKVNLFDCEGNSLSCGDYIVVAAKNIPGFITTANEVTYKKWTPVFIDLSKYVGSCVRIKISAGGCSDGLHYGYGYFDAVCKQLKIEAPIEICAGSSTVLQAPEGAKSYEWVVKGTTAVIGTSNKLIVAPTVETTYQCTMVSVTGCPTVLYHTVKMAQAPVISGDLSTCVSGKVQLTATSTPAPITATVSPWVSSDVTVATISATGLVTALKVGKTKITFTGESGCKNTVEFEVLAGAEIVGKNLLCIGANDQLAIKGSTSTAGTWTSSAPAIVSVSATGSVSALALGESTITLKTPAGCTAQFVIKVNAGPVITNPGPVSACKKYDLPVIAGVNLTGNQKYYDNSQANNGRIISGTITSTQTVYIYDGASTCSSEEHFSVTINNDPVSSPLPDVTVCDQYTLPALTKGSYFTALLGQGTQLSAGAVITTSQTIYTYFVPTDATLCPEQNSLKITIHKTPVLDVFQDVTKCDSYALPALTGGANYYTGQNGAGSLLQPATVISTTQDIHVFAESKTTPNCAVDRVFKVTIHKTPLLEGKSSLCVDATDQVKVNGSTTSTGTWTNSAPTVVSVSQSGATKGLAAGESILTYKSPEDCSADLKITVIATPKITNPGAITVCKSYSLPTIVGTNLSGNQKYYNNSQASNGAVITGPITTTQTVWIYDGLNSCTSEESFVVTVNNQLPDTKLPDVVVCDSYVLPVLEKGAYFTAASGQGTQLNAGATITLSQNIFTYYVPSDAGACSEQSTLQITIHKTPVLADQSDVKVCERYKLPPLTRGNYFSVAGGQGQSMPVGSDILLTKQVYVYAETGTTPNCKAEKSFEVKIVAKPVFGNLPDIATCNSFPLQPLSVGNYYTGANKTGTQLAVGTVLTASQPIFAYAEAADLPACKNEVKFQVTVNQTPVLAEQTDVIACEKYALPVLATGRYFLSPNGQGVVVPAGAQILETQRIYVYAESGTIPNCKAEKSFEAKIIAKPTFGNLPDIVVCDAFALQPLTIGNYYTGANKTGTQLAAGTTITSSQPVFVYAEATELPACKNEVKVQITINKTPQLDPVSDITKCDQYALPVLTVGNYFTGVNGTGDQIQPSVLIRTTQELHVYAESNTIPKCAVDKVFKITINTAPQIPVHSDITACDSYTLLALTIGNYYTQPGEQGTKLNGGETINTSQKIYIYAATTTTPVCFSEISFQVTINPSPKAQFEADKKEGCAPVEILFKTNAQHSGTTGVWDFGDGKTLEFNPASQNIVHKYAKEGCYDVQLKLAYLGCDASFKLPYQICVYRSALASFYTNSGTPTVFDPRVEFKNNSENATTYAWSINDGFQSTQEEITHLFAKDPKSYQVRLIANNAHNCPDTMVQLIEIKDVFSFYVPNAFTPNGDTYNQEFTPVFNPTILPTEYELYIYNRWGQLIFESHDPSRGWKGTFGANGAIVADGVYTWKIIFREGHDMKKLEKVGHVTVIR